MHDLIKGLDDDHLEEVIRDIHRLNTVGVVDPNGPLKTMQKELESMFKSSFPLSAVQSEVLYELACRIYKLR